MNEFLACDELECPRLKDSDITYCKEAKLCPFAHQRERMENEAESQRRDQGVRG